jgi:hypothetical protein
MEVIFRSGWSQHTQASESPITTTCCGYDRRAWSDNTRACEASVGMLRTDNGYYVSFTSVGGGRSDNGRDSY